MTHPAVPVEERLFSLVLALLATETGLTKNEILSSVQGYRQRYRNGGDNANLERQFERDKDDIRDLGVPLETIDSPGDAGNNQTLRYRIPKGAYELPADVAFTPEETALLGLAAMVWREGSLSGESRRALLKLRSLGVTADEPVLGYAPRIRLRDAAFDPLDAAIRKGVRVRFPYLKPGEERASERDVVPLALVQYQGRWHLSALRDGEPRTYLLRRIVGPVAAGRAVEVPAGDHAAAALAELEQVWQGNVAELEIEPGSDAATRLANRDGVEVSGDRATAHFVDLNILADELSGFGPEVFVLAPPELRDAVVARLKGVAAAHGRS
jgi:Predicted transcriptional regulator